MKQRIQGIIIGFLVAAIVFSGVAIAAPAITWKKIDAAFADYKIYVDGVKFEARDKNGVIEPLNYNGWIWAPFEHIAKALGKEAFWDGETNTLYLGSRTLTVAAGSFNSTVPFYDSYSSHGWNVIKTESVEMGGVRYDDSLSLSFSYGDTNYTLHNLSRQYKRVTGYIGRVDGSYKADATYNFYGDGKLIETYKVGAQDLPRQITLNVVGVEQLKIEVVAGRLGSGSSVKYAFADATIE